MLSFQPKLMNMCLKSKEIINHHAERVYRKSIKSHRREFISINSMALHIIYFVRVMGEENYHMVHSVCIHCNHVTFCGGKDE